MAYKNITAEGYELAEAKDPNKFMKIGIGVASLGAISYNLIKNVPYRKGTVIYLVSNFVFAGIGILIDRVTK